MRLSAQRLTLVLLLVARLIVGELASAMPDHGPAHVDHATAAQASSDASCPDHANNSSGSTHDESCCKSACSCPCLHLSAMAPPPLVTRALLVEARPQMPVVGATARHIGPLLRPPA